jgi:hypothetical protein
VTERRKRIFDWTRRVLVGFVLLGSVALTWGRTVCGDALASTGDQGVVRVCRPVAITDAPVLGGLLLILLLLLPDLSEIGIPGFLSLKRQVREQESRLEEQGARLAMLHAEVRQAIGLQQAVSQEVDTRANAMSVNVLDIAGVLRTFQVKAQRELAAANQEDHSEAVIPAARAQLESRLLRAWARLEVPVRKEGRFARARERLSELAAGISITTEEWELARSHLEALQNNSGAATGKRELYTVMTRLAQMEAMRGDYAQQYEAAQRDLATLKQDSPAWQWNADFRQEIQIVRAAHRAVARGEPIEDSKLRAAVRLAEGLLEAWNGRSASVGATKSRGSSEGQRQEPA